MNPKLRIALGGIRSAAYSLFQQFWPQQFWRALPGDSRRFGPPRRYATWQNYHRQASDTAWHEVYPAQQHKLPEPYLPIPATVVTTLDRPLSKFPAQGIAILEQARVLTSDGWIIGRNDTLLEDFQHLSRGHCRFSPVYNIWSLQPVHHLSGHTLNLCSFWFGNFYHRMMESLPRADIFLRAGFNWDDIDHILLPNVEFEAVKQLESRLGIPTRKIHRVSLKAHISCDILYQPSLPSSPECMAPWVVDWHRRLLPPATPNGGPRLYIPRHNTRDLANLPAVEAVLASHGFETADLSNFSHLREQIAAAKYIVAVHGAALTNLLYALPDTRVLELMPTDQVNPCYRAICAWVDLPYAVIVGQSDRERTFSHSHDTNSDFTVDMEDLERGLTGLLQT